MGIWQYVAKIQICLASDLAIPLRGIDSKGILAKTWKDFYVRLFIIALFIIAKDCKILMFINRQLAD